MDDETTDERLRVIAEAQAAFATFMGLRTTCYSRDCVEAELAVRDELANSQ